MDAFSMLLFELLHSQCRGNCFFFLKTLFVVYLMRAISEESENSCVDVSVNLHESPESQSEWDGSTQLEKLIQILQLAP